MLSTLCFIVSLLSMNSFPSRVLLGLAVIALWSVVCARRVVVIDSEGYIVTVSRNGEPREITLNLEGVDAAVFVNDPDEGWRVINDKKGITRCHALLPSRHFNRIIIQENGRLTNIPVWIWMFVSGREISIRKSEQEYR